MRRRYGHSSAGPFFVDFYNMAGNRIKTRDYLSAEAAVRGAYGAHTSPVWEDFQVYTKNGGEHMVWSGRRRDLDRMSISELIEYGRSKGKL